MQDIWSRIENWFAMNAPKVDIQLRPGATDEDIQRTEQFLKIKFPADVRESYRIHDGQEGIATPLMGSDWQLLSLKDIRSDWKDMKALFDEGKFANSSVVPSGPVLAEWWNPKWIAVAYNGAGDLQCLDFAPAPKGNVGQIISFWHTHEKREVLANSFREWLHTFANDLEAGRYRVDDEEYLEFIG